MGFISPHHPLPLVHSTTNNPSGGPAVPQRSSQGDDAMSEIDDDDMEENIDIVDDPAEGTTTLPPAPKPDTLVSLNKNSEKSGFLIKKKPVF